jgi:hypothetical protein
MPRSRFKFNFLRSLALQEQKTRLCTVVRLKGVRVHVNAGENAGLLKYPLPDMGETGVAQDGVRQNDC